MVEMIEEADDAWPSTISRQEKFDLEMDQEILLTFGDIKCSCVFKFQGPENVCLAKLQKFQKEQDFRFAASNKNKSHEVQAGSQVSAIASCGKSSEDSQTDQPKVFDDCSLKVFIEELEKFEDRLITESRDLVELHNKFLLLYQQLKHQVNVWFHGVQNRRLPCLFSQRTVTANASRKKYTGEPLFHRGQDLLAFNGDPGDYRKVGIFLVKQMFTREECMTTCIGSRRYPGRDDRMPCSDEDHAAFDSWFLLPFFRLNVFWFAKIFSWVLMVLSFSGKPADWMVGIVNFRGRRNPLWIGSIYQKPSARWGQ